MCVWFQSSVVFLAGPLFLPLLYLLLDVWICKYSNRNGAVVSVLHRMQPSLVAERSCILNLLCSYGISEIIFPLALSISGHTLASLPA